MPSATGSRHIGSQGAPAREHFRFLAKHARMELCLLSAHEHDHYTGFEGPCTVKFMFSSVLPTKRMSPHESSIAECSLTSEPLSQVPLELPRSVYNSRPSRNSIFACEVDTPPSFGSDMPPVRNFFPFERPIGMFGFSADNSKVHSDPA